MRISAGREKGAGAKRYMCYSTKLRPVSDIHQTDIPINPLSDDRC